MRHAFLTALLLIVGGCVQVGDTPSPLIVNVKADGDLCRVTAAIDISQAANFQRFTQHQLLEFARQANSRRAIIVSDQYVPYKCIGAVIITLQQAGKRVDVAVWSSR
jgi:biopolymer transport protein ExbD